MDGPLRSRSLSSMPPVELDDSNFEPHPQRAPRFLEASVFDQTQRPLREGILEWPRLDDWLKHAAQDDNLSRRDRSLQAEIRVFYVPKVDHDFRVGMSGPNWQAAAASFRLHPSTIEAFLDNNGVLTRYIHRDSSSSQGVTRIDFVIKVPYSTIGLAAVSLSYHIPTSSTRAVYHGAELTSWGKLVDLVHRNQRLWDHPLLVPTLVFLIHHEKAESYRARVDHLIFQIENDTGYGVAGLLQGPQVRARKLAFHTESILIRLQSCQTELAVLSHVLRFNEEFVGFLVQGVEDYGQIPRGGNRRKHDALGEALLQMLELPRSQTTMAISQVQGLKERVQSQTSLIFSLISSEENRISRLVSEASTKVAVASKRDSAAMKTMAVLTMLFLPATFVAAFLSMPLFEWDATDDARPLTSPYIWMYWAITLPLTVTLLAGWLVWSRLQEKASMVELTIAKKRDQDMILGTHEKS